MRFDGRVAVVTGAGDGIGKAIAIRLADEGAGIAALDVVPEKAEATAAEVAARGRDSLAVQVDVAVSAEIQRAVDVVLGHFGCVDVLANNAGINIYHDPFDYTDEEFFRIMSINLFGVWYGCRYFGPKMLESGRPAAIVNTASVGAFQTSYKRAPYMASKGAVVSLTKALALDLADRNIRVNAVAPGVTETAATAKWKDKGQSYNQGLFLTPMRRWARPEDIAAAVAFLASDDAAHITGQTLCVDGGMTAGNQLGIDWIPVEEFVAHPSPSPEEVGVGR